MRIYLLVTLLLLVFSNVSESQIIATSSDGSTLLLKSDGTWVPSSGPEPEKRKVQTFRVPYNSQMLIKGSNEKYGVRYDGDKWNVEKSSESKGSEFEFFHKNGEGYGLVIPLPDSVTLDFIITNSCETIKSNASDFKVVYGEELKVNRNKVHMLIIQATHNGIPVTYYNYYYSGDHGAYQLITYCSQKSFWKFEDDFKDLLNGFVTLN